MEEHDQEGRVITAEFPEYYVVTVLYAKFPGWAWRDWPYRMEWEEAFLAYLKKLEEKKPVIFCGDLNVAHTRDRFKKSQDKPERTPVLPMRSAAKFSRCFWRPVSSTPTAIFTRIKEGVYCWWSYRFSRPERRMPGGASTISACPQSLERPAGERFHSYRGDRLRPLSWWNWLSSDNK